MLPAERRAVAGLASIYGLRMLGLFIVLPVFALYANALPGGADKAWVGFALGAYGFTQALLQIPFGWWSDRIGRKPVIYAGLIVFALGSVIAALAQDVYVLALGRMLQGAGAISGAVLALTADLTRDEVRTKSMALIGMTIGASFILSIALGPVLTQWIGVAGIFWLIAALALVALVATRSIVPDPPARSESGMHAQAGVTSQRGDFIRVLTHPDLLRLNLGIFVLHALLMAIFMAVPFALQDSGLLKEQHWKVYLPVMVASVLLMAPLVVVSNRGGKLKSVFVGAIVLLAGAQVLMLGAGQQVWKWAAALVVFFTAFNVLEASLPSLISRTAPPEAKGTALGVYSSLQFLGPGLGAVIAGYLMQHHRIGAVFEFGIVLTLVWLAVALSMRTPAPHTAAAKAAGG